MHEEDKIRELVRELIYKEMDDATIHSVVMGLEANDDLTTGNNFKRMIHSLQSVNNPTKNDVMVKTFLIIDEEGP